MCVLLSNLPRASPYLWNALYLWARITKGFMFPRYACENMASHSSSPNASGGGNKTPHWMRSLARSCDFAPCNAPPTGQICANSVTHLLMMQKQKIAKRPTAARWYLFSGYDLFFDSGKLARRQWRRRGRGFGQRPHLQIGVLRICACYTSHLAHVTMCNIRNASGYMSFRLFMATEQAEGWTYSETMHK